MIDRYLSRGDDKILDMLNVRYVIGPSAAAEDVEVRESANGAAWTVGSVVRASSPEEEIELAGRIDNKREAVMSDEFLPENYNFAEAEIALKEYRPNYLRYEYEADGDALAVFSEIYDADGWTAEIDGRPARPLRADYILRALELPYRGVALSRPALGLGRGDHAALLARHARGIRHNLDLQHTQ